MKAYAGAAAITAVVFAACLTVVNAQSLKDREYFAAQEKDLAEQVPNVNKKCDTHIIAKFDWSKPPTDRSYSASGYCKAALDGIESVCESQLGKDTVKQKIKSVTCGFGPERAIALKAGAIDYTIHYGSANDADFVQKYLQDNL